MQTNKTTGCKDCGAQCQGARCQQCERIHVLENRDPSYITYECPECGGTTSGKGVTCYQCRGEN